jgi:hypothetical protein
VKVGTPTLHGITDPNGYCHLVSHILVLSSRVCALGKNTKVAFPSNKSRSKGILDVIHSNVSGLMSITLVQGAIL